MVMVECILILNAGDIFLNVIMCRCDNGIQDEYRERILRVAIITLANYRIITLCIHHHIRFHTIFFLGKG